MTSEVDAFVKNLALVAPGKGEAKKTISRGLIRVSATILAGSVVLEGLATDDVMAAYTDLDLKIDEAKELLPKNIFEQLFHEDFTGWFTPEELRNWSEPSHKVDEKFDEKFWIEHVYSTINAKDVEHLNPGFVTMNPDRLRKFSLLEPRGLPLTFTWVEWADQSIIRWDLGTRVYGVYLPIDME